jgi:stage II sporulation protein D
MRVVVGNNVKTGRDFVVTVKRNRIVLAGSRTQSNQALFVGSTPLRINSTAYRGQIEIAATNTGLRVVNIVGLEAYLRGVVPAEIGRLSVREIEALKAQAIAARTYTLAQLGRRASRGFDLYADVRDQVYMGVAGEHAVATRAIEETRGRALTYHGALIKAFFHSTCGGFTANIEDVWGAESVPYLKGVRDSDERGFHCEGSRHFRWTETYSPDDLDRAVSAHLPLEVRNLPHNIGRITRLEAPERYATGRIRFLEVTTTKGSWRIPKERIRWVLRRPIHGAPILRSSYVRIFCDRDDRGRIARAVISGAGNGHGVGMCQWGAIGMARKGYDAEPILKHYFTGVEIANVRAPR